MGRGKRRLRQTMEKLLRERAEMLGKELGHNLTHFLRRRGDKHHLDSYCQTCKKDAVMFIDKFNHHDPVTPPAIFGPAFNEKCGGPTEE